MAVNRSWWFLGSWALAALCSCGHDWESLEDSVHEAAGSGPDSGLTAGGSSGEGASGRGGEAQGGDGQGGQMQGGQGHGGAAQGGSGVGGEPSSGGSSGSSAGGSSGASAGGSSPGQGGAVSAGGTSGSAGQGGCACAADEQCVQGLCVAGVVQLALGYAIDRTEVTRSQYAAWIATQPGTASQSGECAWNDSFLPSASCMSDAKVCQGEACSEQPQVCVDWCDAAAYCQAAGKRLCGAISGGRSPWLSFDSPAQSQWMAACSSNGANKYPYGGGYLGALCNGPDQTQTGCGKGSCTTQKAGALTGCQSPVSGYLGAIDLSGNAAEWEDSCSGQSGASDACRVRGGSFASSDGKLELRCNASASSARNTAQPTIGFRCCSP